MYKLIIQDDEGKTTVVPLIREELTIGRQEGNTIRLTERNVSRKHAKLLRGTEEIIIEDLDSYNGVRVNGSRIQGRAEIKEADRVQIGDYLIEVKADQPNADAETREIAVIPEADVPAAIGVSGSEAATAPTSIPVSTPPPAQAPAPAPAAAMKANGSGPTLATDITAAIVTPDEHASGRLVILSKTMAGREFVLDKPAMVIGRTEENDIWVNHRSISRHHAKVVRENGNYAIVDLQSANGVRVNGEEYGKVELRTRDVVDLGHVRFRFVAPNEDFLFGRDAQPVDIATEGQSSKLLWAAVGLLLLGVVAFLILSGDKKDSGSKAGSDKPIKAIVDDPPIIDDPPPLPTVVNDASVGNTENSANDAQIATFMSQASSAESGKNWGALAQAANKVLDLDPANTVAKAMLAKAELEKSSQTSYEKFTMSLAKTPKKYVLAAAAFDEIAEESVYKREAEEPHEQAKEEFAAAQRAAADKAVAQKGKACQNAISLILSNVPKEWVSVSKEIRGYKCSKDTSRTPNNTTNNNKPPPPPPPKDVGPPIEELLAQAEDALKNTQYGKGSRLCRQVLERDPNNQKALTACAIASCNLKNGSAAKKYVRRIKSSQRRQGLKQICLRLGVNDVGE